MKPVVVVLGGSTPFTAALIEALREARDALPACELRLYGQDAAALERMRRYAERRLTGFGWTSRTSRRLDEAVDGATVVVNQIRFGGLAGRADDEALANRFQLPADETLGPCGLSSALRVIPRIRELASELGRRCPDAWVLNLSNPLSLTTRTMIDAGGPSRTIGLCELPAVTALEACRLLGMSPEDVQWKYAGLNHRGFIFALEHRGERRDDPLRDLASRHHDPHRAGRLERREEVLELGHRDGALSRQGRDGVGRHVVDGHLVSIAHEPPGEPGAHASEADHSELHYFSLSVGMRHVSSPVSRSLDSSGPQVPGG